jgi:aspartate/methionine/tyrosine aminotransferase
MTASKNKIEEWIRPQVRALQAYHVPDPGDMIKLDAMENPYPWPDGLVSAWLEKLRGVSFNRYPDPGAAALKRRMREAMSVPETAQVVLGNGSDELIQMIIQSVAMPGRVIMAPEPTFVMYRQIASVAGPAVIFLAYPNNPTGNLFERGILLELLACAPGLVVVDEAYAPFTDASFMADLPAHDNLLVRRPGWSRSKRPVCRTTSVPSTSSPANLRSSTGRCLIGRPPTSAPAARSSWPVCRQYRAQSCFPARRTSSCSVCRRAGGRVSLPG